MKTKNEQELCSYLERINDIVFNNLYDIEISKEKLETSILEVLEEWSNLWD